MGKKQAIDSTNDTLDLDWGQFEDDKPIDLYAPNGRHITVIDTCVEFAWVRLQIAKKRLSGYYINFDGQQYPIEPTGRINNWPKGLFDHYQCYLAGILTEGSKIDKA